MLRFVQLKKKKREVQNYLKDTFYRLLGTNKLSVLRDNFAVDNNYDLYDLLEMTNNEIYLIEQKHKKQLKHKSNTERQLAMNKEKMNS